MDMVALYCDLDDFYQAFGPLGNSICCPPQAVIVAVPAGWFLFMS